MRRSLNPGLATQRDRIPVAAHRRVRVESFPGHLAKSSHLGSNYAERSAPLRNAASASPRMMSARAKAEKIAGAMARMCTPESIHLQPIRGKSGERSLAVV